MLKWVFDCNNCGARTNVKTSGSIQPENWDEEEQVARRKLGKCYYCNSFDYECMDAFDSTFSALCHEPTKKFKKIMIAGDK